jgi:hypothetical protein
MLPSTEHKENKWSIGTYLRIKPLFQDENIRINYDIQGRIFTRQSSLNLDECAHELLLSQNML